MFNEQKIPCPVCKTPIPFEVTALLQGNKFSCPSCTSIVSIAPESMEYIQVAKLEYDQLKTNVLKQKK
jgi:hypothetical protein